MSGIWEELSFEQRQYCNFRFKLTEKEGSPFNIKIMWEINPNWPMGKA